MPNGNRIYQENTVEVLKILLESAQPVTYRKKISGYGINESEFDAEIDGVKKHPNCSRKIFKTRIKKDNLIKRRLVTELKNNDKRTNYFGITPLGISLLCEKILELDEYQIKKIYTILIFYHNKTQDYFKRKFRKDYDDEHYDKIFPNTDFENILSKIKTSVDSKTLIRETYRVFNLLDIELINRDYFVTFSYKLIDRMPLPLMRHVITHEFHDDFDLFMWMDMAKLSEGEPMPSSDDMFFADIAKGIMSALCFNLALYENNFFENDEKIIKTAKNFNAGLQQTLTFNQDLLKRYENTLDI